MQEPAEKRQDTAQRGHRPGTKMPLTLVLNSLFALGLGVSLLILASLLFQRLTSDTGNYLESKAFAYHLMEQISDDVASYRILEEGDLFKKLPDSAPIPVQMAYFSGQDKLSYLKEIARYPEEEDRLQAAMEESRRIQMSQQLEGPEDYGQDRFLFYRKKDLLAWSSLGLYRSPHAVYLAYPSDQVLFFLQNRDQEKIEAYRASMGEGYLLEDVVNLFEEAYLPIGDQSVLDRVENDLNLYRYWADQLEATLSWAASLEEPLELAEKLPSNLSYHIHFRNTGTTITSDTPNRDLEPVWSAPIHISGEGVSIGQGPWREEFTKAFDRYRVPASDLNDVEVEAKIDTSLQFSDAIKEEVVLFPRAHRIYRLVSFTAILFLIGWVASLCLSLVWTSNANYPLLRRVEGVLPVEVYFLAFLGFGGLVLILMKSFLSRVENMDIWPYLDHPLQQPIWLVVLLVFFLLNAVGWTLLSAFFRKARQRRFYRGSLLYYLLSGLASLWRAFAKGRGSRHRKLLALAGILFGLLLVVVVGTPFGPLAFFLLLGAFVVLLIYLALDQDRQDNELLDYLHRLGQGEATKMPDLSSMTGTNRALYQELAQLAADLKKTMEESLRNERLQTDLITNVSHDLRTPLTSIITYVDLLQSQDLSKEETEKYLDILAKKADRLKQLMNDLIDVSKASSGAMELNLDQLDLVELFRQIFAEMEDAWEKKELSPVVSLPEEALAAYTDGAKLSRIVGNLISNAQKYSQAGTRVYLELKKAGPFADFRIKNTSDQALNMSPMELMERFKRFDRARSSAGSGLGLSIAKNLSQQMGIQLDLAIDADLFTARLKIPLLEEKSDPADPTEQGGSHPS